MKAVLIYDGDCEFCQGSKNWIQKRQIPGEFEYLPCQSEERQQRFPQISRNECMTALQLVLPGGHILSGAEAIPEILLRLKGWHWLEKIFRIGLFRKCAPYIYDWVAHHRYFLSCVLFPHQQNKNRVKNKS